MTDKENLILILSKVCDLDISENSIDDSSATRYEFDMHGMLLRTYHI